MRSDSEIVDWHFGGKTQNTESYSPQISYAMHNCSIFFIGTWHVGVSKNITDVNAMNLWNPPWQTDLQVFTKCDQGCHSYWDVCTMCAWMANVLLNVFGLLWVTVKCTEILDFLPSEKKYCNVLGFCKEM